MPAQPAWFHRLEEIFTAPRAMTSTHLDRLAVEKLFRVCQRRARQIMADLEGPRAGNAAAVSREALIARLEQTGASGKGTAAPAWWRTATSRASSWWRAVCAFRLRRMCAHASLGIFPPALRCGWKNARNLRSRPERRNCQNRPGARSEPENASIQKMRSGLWKLIAEYLRRSCCGCCRTAGPVSLPFRDPEPRSEPMSPQKRLIMVSFGAAQAWSRWRFWPMCRQVSDGSDEKEDRCRG